MDIANQVDSTTYEDREETTNEQTPGKASRPVSAEHVYFQSIKKQLEQYTKYIRDHASKFCQEPRSTITAALKDRDQYLAYFTHKYGGSVDEANQALNVIELTRKLHPSGGR